jgi:hypothetical protein
LQKVAIEFAIASPWLIAMLGYLSRAMLFPEGWKCGTIIAKECSIA